MEKPFYQQFLTWIGFLLAGLLAFGTLLNAISNAISLIRLPIALAGTGAVLVAWLAIEFVMKHRGIRWVARSGETVKLKRLGKKQRLALAGIISLLWLPIVIAQFASPELTPPEPTLPDIYRLRVTVLNPQEIPVEDAKVWSSIGGEPKRVAGGWQFDIPRANMPRDGNLTVYAEKVFLKGKTDVELKADANPSIKIQLASDTSAKVRGIVQDTDGRAIVGAKVSVVGYGHEAVETGANGEFELDAHAPIGDEVRLYAEKDSYGPEYQYHLVGGKPETIVLERIEQ